MLAWPTRAPVRRARESASARIPSRRFVPTFVAASVLGGAIFTGAIANSPAASAASATALSPIVTANCQCSLSVDGLGTADPAGGPIKVQKTAGATVKQALLFAASTGGSTYTPVDGDV